MNKLSAVCVWLTWIALLVDMIFSNLAMTFPDPVTDTGKR
jgi:hypothetical protein